MSDVNANDKAAPRSAWLSELLNDTGDYIIEVERNGPPFGWTWSIHPPNELPYTFCPGAFAITRRGALRQANREVRKHKRRRANPRPGLITQKVPSS